jgi:hypothetical protein
MCTRVTSCLQADPDYSGAQHNPDLGQMNRDARFIPAKNDRA